MYARCPHHIELYLKKQLKKIDIRNICQMCLGAICYLRSSPSYAFKRYIMYKAVFVFLESDPFGGNDAVVCAQECWLWVTLRAFNCRAEWKQKFVALVTAVWSFSPSGELIYWHTPPETKPWESGPDSIYWVPRGNNKTHHIYNI